MYKKPDEIFPVTIVCDRYGGTYSGGAWTAWQLDPWDVPAEVDECDPECCIFWENNTEPVGLGATPQDALQDLIDKLSGKGTWESNPLIFAYEYKRID